MARRNHVLVFAHEHTDLLGAIYDLNVRSKTHRQLRGLLADASSVVRRQTTALNGLERDRIGDFEDLVELAEQHVSRKRQSFVAEMVLLTTIQIGQLLNFAESHPLILSSAASEDVFSFGFGGGLIAAAVAAAATSTNDIIALGLDGIAVAFRLAVSLERTARDIEDSDGTWARVICNLSVDQVQESLQKVNETLRPLNHAYIGQVLPKKVVIFGPPSTLDSMSHQLDLSAATTSSSLPARVPMYGAHLPPVDAAEIIGNSSLINVATVQRPLWSAHSPTGPFRDATLVDLLRSSVVEMTQKSARVEETVWAIAAALREMNSPGVMLTSVGSTWDTSAMQSILQQNLQGAVELGTQPLCPNPFGEHVDNVAQHEIAVVGMSGRFPESDTLDELWGLLEMGQTTHQEIPSSRFNVEDFYDPSRARHNALLARHGCFIKKPGDFDHRLFNISPREALQMDPVQRMLLMTTYEALEMAGYSPTDAGSGSGSGPGGRVPPRIATFFGQTVDDWKTINEQQGIDTHFLPAVNRSFAPGRIGHYFQWAGGFISIDTGCSSSATALCLAREALAAGACDAAVVGGGTLLTAPEWFAGLSQGGFLSPTGGCKTYSDAADGYCRGEGVAVVVLKRLADAVRAKDPVLAVVAGAARNGNAGAASITYPGEQAQAALYRRVLRQAGVRPHGVSVVEMHGTGTQAGDRVEMSAVRTVFASPDEPRRREPLLVGALKASIGHSEAAAGVISLIKAVLMLQHNSIPPQPGQPFTLNPHLAPLLGSDIQLANGQVWARHGSTPRYIVINNFDAAGGNVSLVLHDAPSFAVQQPPSQLDGRTHHVVVASGRTETSHGANKRRLCQFLARHPDTPLADLAYTTTARRMHHVHRDAYVVTSTAELLHQLQQQQSTMSAPSEPKPATSVVFTFTGQGSQHVGMGGTLYRTSPTFRRLLDSYQMLCDAQGLNCRFLNVIRGSPHAASADTDSSTTERDMQVATVALEIALARYWQSLGLRPTLLIGHSLGEYAALCVAGVLSVCDALCMAYERATLIFTRCKPAESGMLAVALPASTILWRLRDSAATGACEVTCFNGPSSTVVGGAVAAIEALEGYLKSDGNVAVTRLRVQHGFHTRQMDPILDDLEEAASRLSFHPPSIPVASTLLGRVVRAGEHAVFNANYLRRHTREPVAFVDAVRSCEAQGLITQQSFVVEVGPHPTCIGLMASSLQEVALSGYPSLRRGRDDWESVSQCLAAAYRAQLPVSWPEFHKDHLPCLRMVSGLPTYAFDNKEFWHSYQTRLPGTPGALLQTSASAAARLSSTSLHSVEKLHKEGSRISATFAVDLSDQQLAKAIGGHVVDRSAICPASIFMDMAYTAAAYLDKQSHDAPGTPSLASYELTALTMLSPLVLREDVEPQRLFVEGVLDQSTDNVSVSVRFLSRAEGASPIEYGSCIVHLGQLDAPVTQAWSRLQPLVKARMRSLHESSAPRDVHAMGRTLFYKLFSDIVDYSAPFRAVEQATIAADFRDAAFVIQVAPAMDLGNFTCSPFAVDALVHVAGFLLNADVQKPKNDVHIANHIGSFRVLADLSLPGPFLAYATIRQQDAKAGTSICDVYLTDSEDKIVAICTDICFKKLDRDFFALLTGSARAHPPNPRAAKASPRRGWPTKHRTPDSSSGLATPSSASSSASLSSSSDVVDLSAELLDVVAAWSGIGAAELNKTSATFAEMGVDSQMSIAILADFQKATAVELPAAFFTNFPTPAAVRKELGSQQVGHVGESKQTTRATSRSSPRRKSRTRSASRAAPSKQLLRLVADALGLEAGDLTPSTTFESIGMDSMLSIKITSAFQQETQIELPAAFFSEQRTVAAAREALDGPLLGAQVENTRLRSPSPVKTPHHGVVPAAKAPSGSTRRQKMDRAVSRAVLIQGQSRSDAAPLFMTTDGSGTVESYIHLGALPRGRRIYALESPFLMCPETFDLSIEDMASIFIRSIRRIQPQGPYLIGGWSAGSIYAYEVAHRLTMQGETILALIILDMRAPSLIPITIVTTDFVEKLGTFEGINRARDLPQDLSVMERTHLMATCRALSQYEASAFPVGRRPRRVAVVWARLGLDNRQDAPVAAMGRPGLDIGKTLVEMTLPEFERYFNSWFYGRREQFGTNGWETLLGDGISVHTVDGDHFSMMCPPFSEAVGSIVANTVVQAVEEE